MPLRPLILLGAVVMTACADRHDLAEGSTAAVRVEAGELACAQRSLNECADSPECVVEYGMLLDLEHACVGVRAPSGCSTAMVRTCGEAPTFAQDPQQRVWLFGNTCFPDTMREVDIGAAERWLRWPACEHAYPVYTDAGANTAEAHPQSAPACADDAIAALHRRVLAEVSAPGCTSDADCVLNAKHAPCVYRCDVAVPKTAAQIYEQLIVSEIYPLCGEERRADCGTQPPLCCEAVKASCVRGSCEAIPLDPPFPCDELSLEACEGYPACAKTGGNRLNEQNRCLYAPEAQECVPRNRICGEAITYARDRSGAIWMYGNACLPSGMTYAGVPESLWNAYEWPLCAENE